MRLLARLRLVLARRPWLYWLAVGLCAMSAWLLLSHAQAQVRAAARSWGDTRRVWVATADVDIGAPLTAEARDYPEAIVPARAVRGAPSGVAAHPLRAGEVLVDGDVAAAGTVAADWVVLALPAGDAPRLVAGADVLVLGNGQLLCDGVVAAGPAGDRVEVAVAPDCAADVSVHLLARTVVLARHG